MRRTLVFWGDAPLSEAQARAARGDRILLWGRPRPAEATELQSADLAPPAAARIEEAAAAWASSLTGRPALEGRAFGELFVWEDEALWPFAQRFLASAESSGGRCVRGLETFSALFELELPDEVEAVGLREDEGRLLERTSVARGVLFLGRARGRGAAPSAEESRGLRERLRAWRPAWTSRTPGTDPARVVFLHPEGAAEERAAAFARLARVGGETVPALELGAPEGPPPETFLDPTGRGAVARAEATFAAAEARLRSAASAADAFRHEGVGFADLALAPDLKALVTRVLPAAVRRGEGVRAALRGTGAPLLCALEEDHLGLAAARLEGRRAVVLGADGDGARTLRALEAAARGEGMVG